MRRATKLHRLIFAYVQLHPGTTAAQLAVVLGRDLCSVLTTLADMEDAAVLLSEDARGGLWAFRCRVAIEADVLVKALAMPVQEVLCETDEKRGEQ